MLSTGKKEKHRRTNESMERYRVLFENIKQGVISQDNEGKIILVNPAAEKALGLTFQEMQNRISLDSLLQIIQEDGSEFPLEMQPAMIALTTGQTVKGKTMGIMNPKEGRHRWLNLSAVPIFKPGEKSPNRVYSIFDDITELKQVRSQLKESQKRYRNTLENMIDGYFEVNLKGDFLSLNQSFHALSGYTAAGRWPCF